VVLLGLQDLALNASRVHLKLRAAHRKTLSVSQCNYQHKRGREGERERERGRGREGGGEREREG
jgi:hypothetical protein